MADRIRCVDIVSPLGRAIRTYTGLVFRHLSCVSTSCPKLARFDSGPTGLYTVPYRTHPFGPCDMEKSDLTDAWLDTCRPKDTRFLSMHASQFIGVTALAFNPFWIGVEEPDEKHAAAWLNGLCRLGENERIGALLPIGELPDTLPNTLLLCETIRNVHVFSQAGVIDAFTRGTGISMCADIAQEYHQALFNFVLLTLNLW